MTIQGIIAAAPVRQPTRVALADLIADAKAARKAHDDYCSKTDAVVLGHEPSAEAMAHHDHLGEVMNAAVEAVHEFEPTTLQEVAAKAAFLKMMIDFDEGDAGLETLAGDLERLAATNGRPAGDDTALVALVAEWEAHEGAYPEDDDDPRRPAWVEKCAALERAIASTPATTIRGIKAKARVLHDDLSRRDPEAMSYETGGKFEDVFPASLAADVLNLGAPPAPATSFPLGMLWAAYQRQYAKINADAKRDDSTEEELNAALDEANALDDQVRAAPCTSVADAHVKLLSVLQMYEKGPRLDGSDREVLEQVAAYLAAPPPSPDATLLALGPAFDDAFAAECDSADISDEELEQRAATAFQAAKSIMEMPAFTLEGFRLKARVAASGYGDLGHMRELLGAGTGPEWVNALLLELIGDAIVPESFRDKVADLDAITVPRAEIGMGGVA